MQRTLKKEKREAIYAGFCECLWNVVCFGDKNIFQMENFFSWKIYVERESEREALKKMLKIMRARFFFLPEKFFNVHFIWFMRRNKCFSPLVFEKNLFIIAKMN